VPDGYGQFQIGKSYEVLEAFRDYDGLGIAAGTRFTVTAIAFLPYEDGLTLTCDFAPTGTAPRPSVLRLQDRPETQGPIIDPAGRFIAQAKACE
jgi:hypothetical protein